MTDEQPTHDGRSQSRTRPASPDEQPTYHAPSLSESQQVFLGPGARLDEYELKSLVGRGGMGDVYRAYDFTLERDVAIKVLHPGSNPERFLHEARIAARISS